MKCFGAVNGCPSGIVAPTFGSIIDQCSMVWDVQGYYWVGPCHSHLKGMGPHGDSVPEASIVWAHLGQPGQVWAHTMDTQEA